jgi:peptidoglycan/xylan/chitin deacetylase (PgdA/CDA1 family)
MKDILVLCYHAVNEDWDDHFTVTPSQLQEQAEFLLSRGYRGVTFSEALQSPPASKTLAITFDDGYRSVFEIGFPILSRLGVPATLFVPTAKIGRDEPLSWPGIDHWLESPFRSELEAATWDQLAELASAGWEIGSHSRTHPHLTALEEEALADELGGSRRDCERRLGRPCRSLAYPYGDVDDRVIEAARRAGYEVAGGFDPWGPSRAGLLNWPRLGVYREHDLRRFRRKVSPLFRRYRASRLWPIVDAARRRLSTSANGGPQG